MKRYIAGHVREAEVLEALAQAFLRMVTDLHSAGFSHGDLQHGNAALCGRIEKMVFTRVVSRIDYTSVTEMESYYVSADGGVIGSFEQRSLFRTKAELLKSQ